MKRKIYSTIFLGLLSIGMMSAQAQNQECMTNLSIYFEHYKVKNYDAAYEPWSMVYDACPGLNKANFSAGATTTFPSRPISTAAICSPLQVQTQLGRYRSRRQQKAHVGTTENGHIGGEVADGFVFQIFHMGHQLPAAVGINQPGVQVHHKVAVLTVQWIGIQIKQNIVPPVHIGAEHQRH